MPQNSVARCSAGSLPGQTLAAPLDWAAVQKVQVDQRVEVQLNTGKTLRGRLVSITTEAVGYRPPLKPPSSRRMRSAGRLW